jgi:hypothetical protein
MNGRHAPRPMRDTFVFDVLTHLLFPVRARPADMLVVRPGHPTRPIVVSRLIDGVMRPVRLGPPDYRGLVMLERAGVIRHTSEFRTAAPFERHPLVVASMRRKR